MKSVPDSMNTSMQKLNHSDDGRGPVRAACGVVCVNGGSSSSGGRPPAATDSAAALTDAVDHDGVNVDSMTTDAKLKMPLSEDKAEVFPVCMGTTVAAEVFPAVCVDATVMAEGQMLTQQPQDEVYEVTISQVVGEPCKQAWEILPLTITDVSKATRLDPVYGKLFNSVRSGNLDTTDKDISRFNGVFSNLYIEDEVLYFGTRVVIPTKLQASLLN